MSFNPRNRKIQSLDRALNSAETMLLYTVTTKVSPVLESKL